MQWRQRGFGDTVELGRKVQVNLIFDFLLPQSRNGLTASDLVAEKSNKEVLLTLWSWGREVHVNLKNDLFLTNGFDRLTSWDIAAEEGNKKILEIPWCWGR